MSVPQELLLNGNRMHHVIIPLNNHSESFVSGGATLQIQLATSLDRYSFCQCGTSLAALLILCLFLPTSVRYHQLPFPYWTWVNFISTEFCNTETWRKLKSSTRKLLQKLTNSIVVTIAECSEGAWICVMSSAIVNPVLSSQNHRKGTLAVMIWGI